MERRNSFIAVIIAIFIALTFSSASSTPKYAIILLTNNDYSDGGARINCKGDVVWTGDGIFLYEKASKTTIQLTNNDYGGAMPEINCKGDVVWMGWNGDSHSYEIFLALRITEVNIDIKPGSDPNSINLKSKGVVPVAVLTTDDFDASEVDPATVKFAGAPPLRWAMEDVDSDGDLDMLFHFETKNLSELNEDSTEATLSGDTTYTAGKRPIEGTDSVKIVHKK